MAGRFHDVTGSRGARLIDPYSHGYRALFLFPKRNEWVIVRGYEFAGIEQARIIAPVRV